MSNTTLPQPTAADFDQLAEIWKRYADALDDLSCAVSQVTGQPSRDSELAAAYRCKAQHVLTEWPLLVAQYSRPAGKRSVPYRMNYAVQAMGFLIETFAKTPLEAADCCRECAAAFNRMALASAAYAVWIDIHIGPSPDQLAVAMKELVDAALMTELENRLRQKASQLTVKAA